MYPSAFFRWSMIAIMTVLLTVVPYMYYRMTYTHAKRLRVVTAGKVYRGGCSTAEGFADAVKEFRIKTFINLRDEAPDPLLQKSYFDQHTIAESQLCKELGVKFIYLELDIVTDRDKVPAQRPKAIEQFLKIMDNPGNYPVLIHCQAGLHRTGCISAIYRMEYEGWSPSQAMRELKAHGFGEYYSTASNDFITQYVLTYQPGRRENNEVRAEENLPPITPAEPVGLSSKESVPE